MAPLHSPSLLSSLPSSTLTSLPSLPPSPSLPMCLPLASPPHRSLVTPQCLPHHASPSLSPRYNTVSTLASPRVSTCVRLQSPIWSPCSVSLEQETELVRVRAASDTSTASSTNTSFGDVHSRACDSPPPVIPKDVYIGNSQFFLHDLAMEKDRDARSALMPTYEDPFKHLTYEHPFNNGTSEDTDPLQDNAASSSRSNRELFEHVKELCALAFPATAHDPAQRRTPQEFVPKREQDFNHSGQCNEVAHDPPVQTHEEGTNQPFELETIESIDVLSETTQIAPGIQFSETELLDNVTQSLPLSDPSSTRSFKVLGSSLNSPRPLSDVQPEQLIMTDDHALHVFPITQEEQDVEVQLQAIQQTLLLGMQQEQGIEVPEVEMVDDAAQTPYFCAGEQIFAPEASFLRQQCLMEEVQPEQHVQVIPPAMEVLQDTNSTAAHCATDDQSAFVGRKSVRRFPMNGNCSVSNSRHKFGPITQKLREQRHELNRQIKELREQGQELIIRKEEEGRAHKAKIQKELAFLNGKIELHERFVRQKQAHPKNGRTIQTSNPNLLKKDPFKHLPGSTYGMPPSIMGA